jgi:WD40 repeat protein
MKSHSLWSLALLAVFLLLGGETRQSAAAPVPAPAKDGEPRDPVATPGDYIYATAYSRDGKMLALAQPKTHDGKGEHKILLFETRTWKQVQKLTGPATHCFGLAFSADGNTVFAGCNDGKIYTWDTKTGTAGPTLDPKAGSCSHIVLSPDGKTLISGHYEDSKPRKCTLQLWDAITLKHVRVLASGEYLAHYTATFTPDGKTVAVGYNNSLVGAKDFSGVIEWDVATGKELKRFEAVRITPGAHPITHAIEYTRDGKWMLVGGGEAVPDPNFPGTTSLYGYLWLFNRTTGKLEKTLVDRRHDYVRKLLMSPDGERVYLPTYSIPQRVFENGRFVEKSNGELQCWDTRTWELKWAVEAEPAHWGLIASPDGKRIGTASTAGFYLFDAKSGDPKGGLVNAKKE